jgi:hypothetical protein
LVDLLDWCWNERPGDTLDVRMAAQPQYLTDELSHDELPPRDPLLIEMEREVLRIWRAFARRRDILVAVMCDAWRGGTIILRGFMADDVKRQIVKIPAAWLSDPWLSCPWEQEELRPLDGAPMGTPHFRELMGYPGSRKTRAANRPAKASQHDIELAYLATWPEGGPQPGKRAAEEWAKEHGHSVRAARLIHTKRHATEQNESQTVTGAKVGANGPLRAHTRKT